MVVDALATVGFNPNLQVGAITESVTVETLPPLLRTDDATLGASMETSLYAALAPAHERRSQGSHAICCQRARRQ